MILNQYIKAIHLIGISEMKEMSNTEINEILSDYELTIKELSETLVSELALRDELEYDKELKNQFISLLLSIQKRRREANVDRKRRKSKTATLTNSPVKAGNNNNNSPTNEGGPSVVCDRHSSVVKHILHI